MLKRKGVEACSKVFWCSSINNFLYVFFPCFQNYNYVAVPMSIFSVNSLALFARVLQEIETKQDIVGINFGQEEWLIYCLKLPWNRLLTKYC